MENLFYVKTIYTLQITKAHKNFQLNRLKRIP